MKRLDFDYYMTHLARKDGERLIKQYKQRRLHRAWQMSVNSVSPRTKSFTERSILATIGYTGLLAQTMA